MSDILDLDAIAKRAEAATPGQLHVSYCDDMHCKNAVVVTTRPFDERVIVVQTTDAGPKELPHRHPKWMEMNDAEVESIICCTLLQTGPHFVGEGDELWDQNAALFAHARADVLALVARVRELEAEVASIQGDRDFFRDQLASVSSWKDAQDEAWAEIREDSEELDAIEMGWAPIYGGTIELAEILAEGVES